MINNNGTLGSGSGGGPTVYPPFEQWLDWNANGGAYTNTTNTTLCSVSGTDTCASLKDTITGNHLQQSTSANRPIWFGAGGTGPNGLPYVQFDGVNDQLITPAFTAEDTVDIYMVLRLDTWVATKSPIQFVTTREVRMNSVSPELWLSTNGKISTAALSTWQAIQLRFIGDGGGTNCLCHYIGTQSFALSVANSSTTQISIGSLISPSLWSSISVARIIAWRRSLSTTEQTTVTNYLHTLYGT